MKTNRTYGKFHIESPFGSRFAQSRNCQSLRDGAKGWRSCKAKSLKAKLKKETMNIIKNELSEEN